MNAGNVYRLVGEIDGALFCELVYVDRLWEKTNSVVGCARVRVSGDIAGMAQLYVHAQMRRRGIGTALLSEAANFARSSGCKAIAWTVQKDSAEAIAFYRWNGATIFCGDGQEYWMGINLEEAAA